MYEKQLPGPRRWCWLAGGVLGIAVVLLFGTLAVVWPSELPWWGRVWFATGALFGAGWAILGIRVYRHGSLDLKKDTGLATGIVWVFAPNRTSIGWVAGGVEREALVTLFIFLPAFLPPGRATMMFSKSWIVGVGIWLSAVALLAAADDAAIESSCLSVRVEKNGSLAVSDKGCGTRWQQRLLPDPTGGAEFRVVSCDKAANELRMRILLPGIRRDGSRAAAECEMVVSVSAVDPDVLVRFRPYVEGEWQGVEYPFAFVSDSADACLLFPHAEGVLLPLRRSDPAFVPLPDEFNHVYDGYGCYCACLGTVQRKRGDGVLCTFNTPELAYFQMVDVAVGDAALSVPKIVWRADKHRFDGERRITFTFSRQGGYVALAKHYLRLYRCAGHFKSLQQKARENPTVERLAGAPVFWLFDSAENSLEVAKMMRADGIERAVIETPANPWWQPERHADELRAWEKAVPQMVDLGYVVSRYDQYRDSFKPDDSAPAHLQARTEAYPDQLIQQDDGQYRVGWPPGFVINPRGAVTLAKAAIPKDVARLGWNGRFVDCAGACSFWEGEDWNPKQPLGAIEACDARRELLEFVAGQKLVVGTEGGIDCLLENLHWLETPMSLVRWTAPSLNSVDMKPVDLRPEYQLNFSTFHRIPFYSLVHHVEVMCTWRWEDGFCRLPQHWQQKNLWSVLYGNTPMFLLNREYYLRWRKEIAQTYRYVCDWAQRVAYAEMESHRSLSEDGEVQESVFSNGLGVVVNLGATPYTLPDGESIPAGSYRTFALGPQRTYSPPPVAEVPYDSVSTAE
jgi:hypothetical protein